MKKTLCLLLCLAVLVGPLWMAARAEAPTGGILPDNEGEPEGVPGKTPAAAASPAANEPEYLTDTRICQAQVKFACGCENIVYGAMVGRYGLVLPATGLYCRQHGNKFSSAVFVFGRTESNKAVYLYNGVFTYEAYEKFQNKNSVKNENNIAWVKFPEPVGDKTGWYEPRVFADEELDRRDLLRRCIVSAQTDPTGILEAWIRVGLKDAKLLVCEIDDGHQNGLPMLVVDADGNEFLAGILIHQSKQFQYIRRITKRVYEDMKNAGVLD